MARIIIPAHLRKFTQNESSFDAPQARNVSESLLQLTDSYPEIRRFLVEQNGNLRNFVRVYVDETDIQALQGGHTPLKDHHTVSLIPSLTEEI